MRSRQPRGVFVVGATDTIARMHVGEDQMEVGVAQIFKASRPPRTTLAPGHDEHSLIYFDRDHGLLISADALWENGFGAVFPGMVGEPGFDDVAAALDLIGSLPVRLVVPGHGRPFSDVAGALARARRRLAGFKADPARHLHHAAKVLLKYHLMEVREQALPDLQRWAADTPLCVALWEREARPGTSAQAWLEHLVDELVAQGALARAGLRVLDC